MCMLGLVTALLRLASKRSGSIPSNSGVLGHGMEVIIGREVADVDLDRESKVEVLLDSGVREGCALARR